MAEDEGVLRLTEMGDAATIQHVFELVLRLKQICNFDPATGDSAKLERLQPTSKRSPPAGRRRSSSANGSTRCKRLVAGCGGSARWNITARSPAASATRVIEQFRDDPKRHVLLMSYGAGGVGLNLQFAGYVFLFDRWWNPAVEDQAINRAHRIGAAGPVTVTRFLTLDTIEERIDQILQEKRELFDTIFSDADPHRHSGLTQQEIFGLFKLRCPARADQHGGVIRLVVRGKTAIECERGHDNNIRPIRFRSINCATELAFAELGRRSCRYIRSCEFGGKESVLFDSRHWRLRHLCLSR